MDGETLELKEELLWERCLQSQDMAARSVLIERYSEVVRKIAATLFAKRPDDEVEFDDYYQFGMVGLIESVDRYQPGKGAAFETFASYRIRGSILNGLEKLTERRDQNAFRAKMRKERLDSLSGSKNKKNSLFEEMVEVTLGLAIGFMLEDTGLVQEDGKLTEDHAYRSKEITQLKRQLVAAVDALPERERFIIQYHYFHQTNFDNLSEVMGITKGRVSQLHKRALEMVREKLRGKSLDDYF